MSTIRGSAGFRYGAGSTLLDRKSISGRYGHEEAGTDRIEATTAKGVPIDDTDDHDESNDWEPADASVERKGTSKRLVRRVEATRLRLTPQDVLVERTGPRLARPMPPPQRGKITQWSRRSRQGLKLALRGVEGLTYFATLTYGGDPPSDPAVIRKHWERIRHWLTRRGYRGVWRREVQMRGALHYHILIGGEGTLDAAELMRAWARATDGSADPHRGADVSTIRDRESVASYLAKLDGLAGEGEAVGRYWGCFGGAKVAIKVEVEGDAAAVAKVVRVARHLERAQRCRAGTPPRRRDNGQWNRVIWGAGRTLADVLSRLVTLYDLGESVRITLSARQEDETPPSPAPSPQTHAPLDTRGVGRGGWLSLRSRL